MVWKFSSALSCGTALIPHITSSRFCVPGATKIKIGGGSGGGSGGSGHGGGADAAGGQGEFIERRRAALERYLNRTAAHPTLRADPDFREFLELGEY